MTPLVLVVLLTKLNMMILSPSINMTSESSTWYKSGRVLHLMAEVPGTICLSGLVAGADASQSA